MRWPLTPCQGSAHAGLDISPWHLTPWPVTSLTTDQSVVSSAWKLWLVVVFSLSLKSVPPVYTELQLSDSRRVDLISAQRSYLISGSTDKYSECPSTAMNNNIPLRPPTYPTSITSNSWKHVLYNKFSWSVFELRRLIERVVDGRITIRRHETTWPAICCYNYLVKFENPIMLLILTASSTTVDMFLRTPRGRDLTFNSRPS